MEEELVEKNEFEELTAKETWEKLYGRELNCKKHILEYIDLSKILKKENLSPEKIEETYHFIYEHIEGLKDLIKPNTMMHLKNVLHEQLGRFVKEEPKATNHFIEFFELAYPPKKRRKDFTRVLMDLDTISADQVWTTLTYINKEYMNRSIKLNAKQKKDIAEVIKMSVDKNNVKFTEKLMSLRRLTDYLKIRIEKDGRSFKVKSK